MPPKKRKCIGKRTSAAKRQKAKRASETTEQRELRLEQNRIRVSASRAKETSEERELRLQQQRMLARAKKERELRVKPDRRRKKGARMMTRHSDIKLGAFNYNSDYTGCPDNARTLHPDAKPTIISSVNHTEELHNDESEDDKYQLSNIGVEIKAGDVETILTEDPVDIADVLIENSTNEIFHSPKQLINDSSPQRLQEEESISALKNRLMQARRYRFLMARFR